MYIIGTGKSGRGYPRSDLGSIKEKGHWMSLSHVQNSTNEAEESELRGAWQEPIQ